MGVRKLAALAALVADRATKGSAADPLLREMLTSCSMALPRSRYKW